MQMSECQQRLQWQEVHMIDKHKLTLSETKCRELESKLSYEQSVKERLEAQLCQVIIIILYCVFYITLYTCTNMMSMIPRQIELTVDYF